MIALLTRGFLVLMLVLVVLIWQWGNQPLSLALAWVVIGFIVIKTLITLGGFTIAYFANRGDPVGFKLHPMRLVFGLFEESWATTRSMIELLPFRVSQTLPRPSTPMKHRLPVLMIHGFVCNRGYWMPTAHALVERGYVVEAITLEPTFGSIDAYVPTIENAIDSLVKETGHKQVVVVCHSMGGLAIRAHMRVHGDARIRHIITCGTPHRGTVLASLGIGDNARQMERGHAWIDALEKSESPLRYTKFTTMYSRIDNIVAPARTAVLPSAKEIEFDDVGHVAMAIAPRFHAVLMDEVDRVSMG
jgi:pimeloyl-ACP methyl ester carboxylesterase